MYEKCIACDSIGVSCVPNLTRMEFSNLIQWCIKRQKHLGWTNQMLADISKVPIGTINRIKAGDYMDCKYSTIRSLLIALIGGTTDEFPCNKQIEKELEQMEALEKQAEKLSLVEKENKLLREESQKKIDHLLAEINYLRKDNELKAKVIDKFLNG